MKPIYHFWSTWHITTFELMITCYIPHVHLIYIEESKEVKKKLLYSRKKYPGY